jgi:hypothetical protein
MRFHLSLLGALLVLACPDAVHAQGHGGVAGSGMTDGAASVTTRTNVDLSLESAPGTGAARVAAWGTAMGGRMPAIRTCYEEVVASRPTVEGTLRMLMTLTEGRGGVHIEVSEDGVNDAPLVRCVRGVLDDVPTADLHRPSGAFAVMRFSNTASRAHEATAVAAAEADTVPITREGGVPSATGEAREGLMRWTVRGAADTSDEAISEAYRIARSQIAGLLDCRRRASRRERDPSGTLTFAVRMRAGRAADVTARESTVSDPTAARCVTQRLERAPHRPAAAGSVTLEITFTP